MFGPDEASDGRSDAAGAPRRVRPRVGPDPRPLRHRILPRTAIGISIAILFFAFGASLSGVVLYSYYEYRLTQNEDRVSALTNGLPAQAQRAGDALKAQTAAAQNLINAQLAPLKSVLATGQTVQALAAKVAPALYFVHTLDQAGQPSVGTAFAVASDSRQTLLLTSYTVVQAATRQPGPQVFVRHGSADQALTVYTWDEAKDLALLILPTGGQPTLAFASTAPQVGERVFAVSGLGSQGASITQGFVADVSADGIQHDATTGPQFQGGPLLNSEGQAVGVLSRTYAPLAFPVADVWFAVPPAAACAKVLSCPSGTTSPSNNATAGAAGP
jgi:S1-C subfamily serine protease